jgi:LysM repeat protein
MLFADGPSACPFVALESDRDRRADEPDARHRCYAVPTPEPRALAHQREFCLSPGFGRCPIFQDWAIRAAARPVPLRPIGRSAEPAPAGSGGPEQLPVFGALGSEAEPASAPVGEPPLVEPPVESAPPVAAVPPPAAEAPRYARPIELPTRDVSPTGDSPPAKPQGVERIPSLPLGTKPATDEPIVAVEPPPAAEKPRPKPRWTDDWPPAAASAAAAAAAGGAASSSPPTPPAPSRPVPAPRRPAAAAGADAPLPPFLAGRTQTETGRPVAPRPRQQAKPSQRDEWVAQRADLIPPWERERYTAYPTIRSRLGMGDSEALLGRLTRILGIIALVAVAIALLILAPGFFAGGGPGPSATPSASPSTTITPTASPTVAPSPTISFGSYTVRAGDSLSAIAVDLGLLPCQLQVANPAITNPNLITIGQVLRVPPDDFGLDQPPCVASPSPAP